MALQFGGAGAAGAAEEPALVGGSFGAADSFPKDFGYGEEEEEAELEGGPGPGGPGGGAGGPGGGAGGADSKPRILLMGLRRSGKSSIQKVRGGRTPGTAAVEGRRAAASSGAGSELRDAVRCGADRPNCIAVLRSAIHPRAAQPPSRPLDRVCKACSRC